MELVKMDTFTYVQCIPCLLLAFTLATGNTEGIIGSCKKHASI